MNDGHFYILPVFGCTDPEPLVGPFDDFDSMLVEARKIRASQGDDDALFWLVTGTCRVGCADPAPQVNSFCSVDIDPEEIDPEDDATG